MNVHVSPTSTVKHEMEVGRSRTPDFAWATVVLAIVLPATFVVSSATAFVGVIGYLPAAIVNTVVIYALYTVVHEAIHANISSRRRDLRWVDTVCGMVCCFPLWLFMDQHRKQHMVHHARANHEDDPDIYAKGGFWGWIVVRLPIALVGYFNPWQLWQECKRFGCTQQETRHTFATFALSVVVVAGLLLAGYAYEVLVLWFVPWWIGQTVMLTLFTWTPHHDHTETGRYRDTRISEWPGGNLLLLGQGYHLIHHMMPGVPFYRYKATFNELRGDLERNGARLEGFWPRTMKRH